jgi:hypothetical protein
LARTLQQVLDSANALFERTGLMLVDHAGALRWASASDQVAAPVSAGRSGSPRAWPRSGSMYSSFSTRRLRVVHRREDTQVIAHTSSWDRIGRTSIGPSTAPVVSVKKYAGITAFEQFG